MKTALPETYTFAALFTKEWDGSYSISFPQLEGCYTQGDDFEDALRMATDALSLHLYGMEQDGEVIPEADLYVTAESDDLVVPITAQMTPFRNAP